MFHSLNVTLLRFRVLVPEPGSEASSCFPQMAFGTGPHLHMNELPFGSADDSLDLSEDQSMKEKISSHILVTWGKDAFIEGKSVVGHGGQLQAPGVPVIISQAPRQCRTHSPMRPRLNYLDLKSNGEQRLIDNVMRAAERLRFITAGFRLEYTNKN